MVSQHIAKVQRARARLGSIPRLSAKVFTLGVRRIRLAAPACRAEYPFGASRFESGDTHETACARSCDVTSDEELDLVRDLCEPVATWGIT